uniref:Phosphatidylinositol-3-phosphatase SAC1 n=1 Tax=Gongylonema pulchrum TaxID=637853 RepID=A0A183EQ96_9BILA
LFWSQKPNLRWQPEPVLNPTDDQTEAYKRHMIMQQHVYGGKLVIVNLVNQRGREKRVGGELDRVVLRAHLDFVRLNAFDFHKECQALNWGRLGILKEQLRGEITEFGCFRLNAFDFHKECQALNWGRLGILKEQLRGEITEFGCVCAFS